MKVEIEIPDLETIFSSYGHEEDINSIDLARYITDAAIDKYIDAIFDNSELMLSTRLNNKVDSFIKDHGEDIIALVVDKVSEEIIKKKTVKEQMPKKSEFNAIDKEWENYFIELIDKAIAKRFNV